MDDLIEIEDDEVDDIFEAQGTRYKEKFNEFALQCTGRPASYATLRLKHGFAAIAACPQFAVIDNSIDSENNVRHVHVEAVSKGDTAEEAEKNAAECAMRRLREGRGDADNHATEPFVEASGKMQQPVSKPIVRARFRLQEKKDKVAAEGEESWHSLGLTRALTGQQSMDPPPKKTAMKIVSKIAQLKWDQGHGDNAQELEQSKQKAQRKIREQPLELFRECLYRLLFKDDEPLYMPSVSLSLYWPGDPHATNNSTQAEAASMLPCMIAFSASENHVDFLNVVLDLLPLGRSMAEKEEELGNGQGLVSDTHACVKALGLVQKVLEDHSKLINIVMWDNTDLHQAQRQLRCVNAEPLELSVVGCSLKDEAARLSLHFSPSLDPGLKELEISVLHSKVLYQTKPRSKLQWCRNKEDMISADSRRFGALEASVLLSVYQRLCKFQELSSIPAKFQRIPTPDPLFDSGLKERLRSKVEHKEFEFTPAQGADGMDESQGSQMPLDAEQGGAADGQPGLKGAAGLISAAPQAGNRQKWGRPGDARGREQPAVSNGSMQGPARGRGNEHDEVLQPIPGKSTRYNPEVDFTSGATAISAAPVRESGPARKQRLGEEEARQIELREAQQRERRLDKRERNRELLNAVRAKGFGEIKVDKNGCVTSGMPIKAKKSRGKRKREAETQRAAAQDRRGQRPSYAAEPIPGAGGAIAEEKPYIVRYDLMTPKESEWNKEAKKAIPKHRRPKRSKVDYADEPLPPVQPQPPVQQYGSAGAGPSHREPQQPVQRYGHAGAGPSHCEPSTSQQYEAGPSRAIDSGTHTRAGRHMSHQPDEVEAGEVVDPARQQQVEEAQRRETVRAWEAQEEHRRERAKDARRAKEFAERTQREAEFKQKEVERKRREAELKQKELELKEREAEVQAAKVRMQNEKEERLRREQQARMKKADELLKQDERRKLEKYCKPVDMQPTASHATSLHMPAEAQAGMSHLPAVLQHHSVARPPPVPHTTYSTQAPQPGHHIVEYMPEQSLYQAQQHQSVHQQPANAGTSQVYTRTTTTVRETVHVHASHPEPPNHASSAAQHHTQIRPQQSRCAWGEPVQKPVHHHMVHPPPGMPTQHTQQAYSSSQWQGQHVQRPPPPPAPQQPPPSLQHMQQPSSPPTMQYAPLVQQQHHQSWHALPNAAPAVSAPGFSQAMNQHGGVSMAGGSMPPATSLPLPSSSTSAPVTHGSVPASVYTNTLAHAQQPVGQTNANSGAAHKKKSKYWVDAVGNVAQQVYSNIFRSGGSPRS